MPKGIIGKPPFGKKAVNMRIPFKRAAEGMKDTDKARDKVFLLIQGEKVSFNDVGNGVKEAVKQGAVVEKKMSKRWINGENKVSMVALY